MNGADAVLWAIDADPNLRSTVTTLALLDRPPVFDDLRRRVKETTDAFPRLQQRVVEPPIGIGPPRWVDAPAFDLDSHVHLSHGGGADTRGLLELAAAVAREGVDREAPLWQIVVVDDLEGGAGSVIVKFHHSLTDGVGGMELLLSMLDWSKHPRHRNAPGSLPNEPGAPVADQVLRRVAAGVGAAAGLPGAAFRSAARPVESARRIWETGESVVKLLNPGTTRLSPLFKGHSERWIFDTYELPMSEIRHAAAAAGGTVNDVFMAAVTGSLYRYHAKLGHEITGLRVNLPVSFRKPGDPAGGNRFTPVRFVVPVDEPDPLERARQLGALCRAWRAEPALPLTENIAFFLSRFPRQATTAVFGSMLYGVDFVATNVAGVDRRCYIAGAEVLRQFAFAPPSGAAVNFALVSHVGTACVGVNMDEAAVPEPELLMACLRDGFDEVTSQTGA